MGNGILSSVKELDRVVQSTTLYPAYPNPFAHATKIRFDIEEASNVSITIHNMLGNIVATVFTAPLGAGSYETEFISKDVPAGCYVFQLQTETRMLSRTMLVNR